MDTSYRCKKKEIDPKYLHVHAPNWTVELYNDIQNGKFKN